MRLAPRASPRHFERFRGWTRLRAPQYTGKGDNIFSLAFDEADGIDKLEQLQQHENEDIYDAGERALQTPAAYRTILSPAWRLTTRAFTRASMDVGLQSGRHTASWWRCLRLSCWVCVLRSRLAA